MLNTSASHLSEFALCGVLSTSASHLSEFAWCGVLNTSASHLSEFALCGVFSEPAMCTCALAVCVTLSFSTLRTTESAVCSCVSAVCLVLGASAPSEPAVGTPLSPSTWHTNELPPHPRAHHLCSVLGPPALHTTASAVYSCVSAVCIALGAFAPSEPAVCPSAHVHPH